MKFCLVVPFKFQELTRYKFLMATTANGRSGYMHGNDGKSETNPKPKTGIFERMSTTFFLTNFPHNITSKDVWNKCLRLGTVTDVFISSRLSKVGKRFGFVRFIKVNNIEKLLMDLRGIWFGNYRVFADIEKYGRKFSSKNKSETSKDNSHAKKATLNKEAPTSYAEAVSGASGKSQIVKVNNTRVVKLMSASGASEKDSRSLLLKHVEPCNILLSRKWFFDEGFVDFEIVYVGGRWVQATFIDSKAMNDFLANVNLKSRFLAVKKVCGNFVPDERMVWVEVSGVPRGAWTEENFQVILGPWGKGIFFLTDWQKACSMGKVCVLTNSSKFIEEELQVEFEDGKFDIWLKEFSSWEPSLNSENSVSSESWESDFDDGSGNSQSGSASEFDSKERSQEFDSDLCKGDSTDRDGVGSGTAQASGVEGINAEVGQADSEDVFSLYRIIDQELANSKRARSCPPAGSRDASSNSKSGSSGAPGFKRDAFPAWVSEEKDNTNSDSGLNKSESHVDSVPKSSNNFENGCNSQGSVNEVNDNVNYVELGNNMGFTVLGENSDAKVLASRISEVNGYQ